MTQSPTTRLLQIFNRSLGTGGEELAVNLVARLLEPAGAFRECRFQSSDWTGSDAPPVWQQAAWMFYNPRSVRLIRTAHQEHRPAAWILHNFLPVASAGVYREALRLDVPIIQFVHNFRPFSVNSYSWAGRNLEPAQWRRNFVREVLAGSWQGSRLKTAWLALVLSAMHALRWFRAVKGWVAVSDFMRRQFIAAGVPAADIFTLRHPWTPMAEAPQAPDGGHYLFLGRLIEEKGVKVLIEAWRLLHGQLGAACPRLVIGGDGPLATWLSREIREFPCVEFSGLVAGRRKAELLAGCRALIVPSVWREPLGLVVYEAFDYGKPVLAAASGGLAELVQDGVTGRQHRPGDAVQLAGQVAELNRADAWRRELGAAGRSWLLAHAREDEWKEKFGAIVAHAVRRRGVG